MKYRPPAHRRNAQRASEAAAIAAFYAEGPGEALLEAIDEIEETDQKPADAETPPKAPVK
jgi:hypothetical protein